MHGETKTLFERRRKKNFRNFLQSPSKTSVPELKAQMKAGEEREDGEEAVALWDCGSPLYDSFELVSLAHLLDRKLMAFAAGGGESGRLTSGWFSNGSDRASPAPSSKGEVRTTRMLLLRGLMGMRTRKQKVNREREKERSKKMKASFRGLCGSFAFWKK